MSYFLIYHLPEKYLPLIKLEQDVRIYVNNIVKPFYGKIVYVSPYVDNDSREGTIEASIHKPNQKVLPGMFVTISQNIHKQTKAITIPANAIHKDKNVAYVFLMTRKNKTKKVNVLVGPMRSSMVDILNNTIKPGDKVIVAAPLDLQQGIAVKQLVLATESGA